MRLFHFLPMDFPGPEQFSKALHYLGQSWLVPNSVGLGLIGSLGLSGWAEASPIASPTTTRSPWISWQGSLKPEAVSRRSHWQTYSYQAGEAWRGESSAVVAASDPKNLQHPDLEDLQALFATIHEKAVAAGALQSAAIDPALNQEQARLDHLLTQLRQQEAERQSPVLVASASPSPDPLWTTVPHSPSAEVDPVVQPLPPQQVTDPQPPQIQAPSAVNRERARLEQVLAELRQEKSPTSPPQAAPPVEISSPVVQRSDPAQPLAPREDGTVILTPSLEQTQPLELLTEPLFTAPPLSDLPSSITDVPETQDQLLQPQPFLGQLGDSDVLPPLRRDTLIPFPETVAILPPEPEVEEDTSLSPLQRPMTSLFGFETASSLHQGEVILKIGANTFGNPQDFRTVLFDQDNRSNDIRLGFDVGLTDQLQFSLGAEGKDDTIFANIFAEESGVSFIYQGIPAQLKWRVHEGETLSTAVVLGAQFAANTVPGRIDNQALSTDPASRKLILTTDRSVSNALLAEDSSIYYSLAVPISYQMTPRIRFHANPQVSVFPDRIPVTNVQGDAASLVDADVGFDGETLDYFGTVVGWDWGWITMSMSCLSSPQISPRSCRGTICWRMAGKIPCLCPKRSLMQGCAGVPIAVWG
ncbi:MAG: hypothetical protein HC921_13815 [Synechococcaceae cyanobacterium SM2_3_1]|nr:hypothetical protein [Synechococcaceae cyanobacterium SM2_3_1]